ncbi:MAG: hypothetical protein GMKNLPBB_02055 [Myxococcota bacterium]|nr:hypothetical protein [Myxococcota bacterium]
MNQSIHRIYVGKDTHKFSAAHMTVFPDGTKERLHGHNFQVTVAFDLTNVEFQSLVDFGMIKQVLSNLCLRWDQQLILAAHCPHFRIQRRDSREIEFELCGKHYVAPADEVLLLPLTNIVVETLAMEFARQFVELLGDRYPAGVVAGLEVTISESHGQGGAYYHRGSGDTLR